MIVIKPFEGVRANLTNEELALINAVVGGSAVKWIKQSDVVELFAAAKITSEKWVYLRSEGCHQYEPCQGSYYKHLTLH